MVPTPRAWLWRAGSKAKTWKQQPALAPGSTGQRGTAHPVASAPGVMDPLGAGLRWCRHPGHGSGWPTARHRHADNNKPSQPMLASMAPHTPWPVHAKWTPACSRISPSSWGAGRSRFGMVVGQDTWGEVWGAAAQHSLDLGHAPHVATTTNYRFVIGNRWSSGVAATRR